MRSFDELYAIAVERKGSKEAVEAHLPKAKTKAELAALPDNRWLAEMARAIFQAGFSWKVIEAKWPGFEVAFEGFEPARVAMYGDDNLARLISDKGIVRNGPKITAVIENAIFLTDLARENGSAAKALADWPDEDYIGLLEFLKKRGSRLGGNTGQRVCRAVGKPSFIFSTDVVARLIAEGIVDKEPSSKREMVAVQEAFNEWSDQSGRSLSAVSRLLAMTV
ncbi:MAG TPA: DNA-3-methyladenine glycosylase I [Paracoccaceae bacterium]|nr:DNA-3-methyladenine glycosylase I [Paracoccaceae bacterium]